MVLLARATPAAAQVAALVLLMVLLVVLPVLLLVLLPVQPEGRGRHSRVQGRGVRAAAAALLAKHQALSTAWRLIRTGTTKSRHGRLGTQLVQGMGLVPHRQHVQLVTLPRGRVGVGHSRVHAQPGQLAHRHKLQTAQVAGCIRSRWGVGQQLMGRAWELRGRPHLLKLWNCLTVTATESWLF